MWEAFQKDITNLTDRYIPKSKPNQVKKTKQPWFSKQPWYSKDVIQAVRKKQSGIGRPPEGSNIANWDFYIKVRNNTT